MSGESVPEEANSGNFIFFAIMASALTLGLAEDLDTEPYPFVWAVRELVYTAIFAVEAVAKISALRMAYFRDAWNGSDLVLTFVLFLRPDGYVAGYFESEIGMEETWEKLIMEPACNAWHEKLRRYTFDGGRPDKMASALSH